MRVRPKTEGTPKLFGTDGVRGLANAEITVELAVGLARAAARLTDLPVVVGRDPRRSSPMLAAALMAGFNSAGLDTVDLGIIPVGGVSRLVRDMGAGLGVMVSASHNPAPDNGIKFFAHDGRKLDPADEARLEAALDGGGSRVIPIGPEVGIQTVVADAVERYVERIAATARYSMRGLEFVVDCAHGAAFRAAPMLFERVGATARILFDEPNGVNINDRCGATHPEVVARKAHGKPAFAFDGDADRLIAVDEDGRVVDGDVIMAIIANWLHEQGRLKRDTVVVTVMSNLGFREAMRRIGVEVVEVPVGDRNVVEAMRRIRAVLGGEQSGHVVLEDRTTGDGLRTALRLMEVMAATGRELRELRRVMTVYPQVLRNVPVERKQEVDAEPEVAAAIERVRARLGERGRILVRASGTEPLVRVMVEAPSEEEAATAADAVAEVVAERLG
ncbi:MAG TPA: phosphoglucosamine mutase [Actinobacteria bacterium]|nr:phosphoglucosamine mutase [Actinomycetota bacterium]